MCFRLVALNQIAEHFQVILCIGIQILAINQLVNHRNRLVQFCFLADRTERKPLIQLQVNSPAGTSLTRNCPGNNSPLSGATSSPPWSRLASNGSWFCPARVLRGGLTGSGLPIRTKCIFFPFFLVVLLVIENVANEYFVTFIVNHDDQSIFIPANVKYNLISDKVSMSIGLSDISKTRPTRSFYSLIPCA